MKWDSLSRAYYFRSDAYFRDRYCKPSTPQSHLGLPIDRAISMPLPNLRYLIEQLTHSLPKLDHNVPTWSPGPQPTLVMGKSITKGIQKKNRCGLCEVNDSIYFWLEMSNAYAHLKNDPSWVEWRVNTRAKTNDEQWRYTRALDPFGQPDPVLAKILDGINEKHISNTNNNDSGNNAPLKKPLIPPVFGDEEHPGPVMVPRSF